MDQNQEKRRGRPPLENKSNPIHWSIPHDIHQFLEKEQKNIRKLTGLEASIQDTLEGLCRKLMD